MSGFVGTEAQIALQKKCVSLHESIMQTPGAVQNARMRGTDDPESYGWHRIAETLAEDGFVGLRLIPRDHLPDLRARLAAMGARLDCWDVYAAAADELLARPVPELPDGFTLLDGAAAAESERVREIQDCMAAQGVAPMPAPFLNGTLGPCSLAAILDGGGRVVCTAFAHFPHNAHSAYRRWAWSGLVATIPEARGRGLAVAAHLSVLQGIVRDHGAEHVYALARAENTASVRMLEKSGLGLVADRISCMGRLGDARFTR